MLIVRASAIGRRGVEPFARGVGSGALLGGNSEYMAGGDDEGPSISMAVTRRIKHRRRDCRKLDPRAEFRASLFVCMTSAAKGS